MPGGARRWCFTINNPRDEPLALHADLKFLVYQLERGEQGTPHYQGYCVCNGVYSLGRLKTALGYDSAHLEHARGSHEQCVAYCTKDDTRIAGPWTLGEQPPGQGARTDLADLCKAVIDGKTDHEIAVADPVGYVRHYKGLTALRIAVAPPARRVVSTMVLWGESGAGKTYWCFDRFPGLFRPCLPGKRGDAMWWDGYAGEDCILLDDFYGQIELTVLLAVLDSYPMRVPVKGSFVAANWTKVLITSNQHPSEWYRSQCIDPKVMAALNRRLTSVTEITNQEDLPNRSIWDQPPPADPSPSIQI